MQPEERRRTGHCLNPPTNPQQEYRRQRMASIVAILLSVNPVNPEILSRLSAFFTTAAGPNPLFRVDVTAARELEKEKSLDRITGLTGFSGSTIERLGSVGSSFVSLTFRCRNVQSVHTRNTFMTSSPRWLMTFTAIRPTSACRMGGWWRCGGIPRLPG